MGDCTSKPNYIEVENHVKHISTVNDAFFHEPLLLSEQDRDQLFRKLTTREVEGQMAADSYAFSLQSQLIKVNERLHLESQVKAKLVVEVRKGMDIYPVCTGKSKGVFVRVNTAPEPKEFSTTLSDNYIPKWYNLGYFTCDSEQRLQSLTLRVYSKGITGEETAFASCVIDLRQSTDKTVTQWYMLTLEEAFQGLKIKPQLEVRIWNLKNQYSFWYHVKDVLEAELGRVETALSKSRSSGLPIEV